MNRQHGLVTVQQLNQNLGIVRDGDVIRGWILASSSSLVASKESMNQEKGYQTGSRFQEECCCLVLSHMSTRYFQKMVTAILTGSSAMSWSATALVNRKTNTTILLSSYLLFPNPSPSTPKRKVMTRPNPATKPWRQFISICMDHLIWVEAVKVALI